MQVDRKRLPCDVCLALRGAVRLYGFEKSKNFPQKHEHHWAMQMPCFNRNPLRPSVYVTRVSKENSINLCVGVGVEAHLYRRDDDACILLRRVADMLEVKEVSSHMTNRQSRAATKRAKEGLGQFGL